MDSARVVLDRDDMRRTLVRIAHEIVEQAPDPAASRLVGIHTRGRRPRRPPEGPARRAARRGRPLGELDISFYRDDVATREGHPGRARLRRPVRARGAAR
jgi:pyrimidine operon attenuation protein/uracil phosphoribosyltransferase